MIQGITDVERYTYLCSMKRSRRDRTTANATSTCASTKVKLKTSLQISATKQITKYQLFKLTIYPADNIQMLSCSSALNKLANKLDFPGPNK